MLDGFTVLTQTFAYSSPVPFDPSLPHDAVNVGADVLRGQFTGLKELIDAGLPGSPGEVTTAALDAAVAGVTANSAANTNGVTTLDTPLADPDAEALRAKINELILAQRR